MKLLVIGASSFTGSHFCDYARGKGADVHEASLRSMKALAQELSEPQEYIVNFAALNVVAPSWTYPSDYLFTNVYTLTTIIDWLKDKPLDRFLQVSTPEVYGSTAGWIKESHPYNPSTPYAVTRAAAEMMLSVYAKEYGFPMTITRACNTYGPGQQLYRLIPKVIASIRSGARFKLEGGGASQRAFVHVRDYCDALWRVLTEGRLSDAYHISTRELQPISGIVRHICERIGISMDKAVELVPERPGKDAAYMLDSGKIRSELGWQDTVSMNDGIDEVIEWIDKKYKTWEGVSLEYQHRP